MYVAIYIFSSDLIFFSGHTVILPRPYDQGLLILHGIYKKARKGWIKDKNITVKTNTKNE